MSLCCAKGLFPVLVSRNPTNPTSDPPTLINNYEPSKFDNFIGDLNFPASSTKRFQLRASGARWIKWFPKWRPRGRCEVLRTVCRQYCLILDVID